MCPNGDECAAAPAQARAAILCDRWGELFKFTGRPRTNSRDLHCHHRGTNEDENGRDIRRGEGGRNEEGMGFICDETQTVIPHKAGLNISVQRLCHASYFFPYENTPKDSSTSDGNSKVTSQESPSLKSRSFYSCLLSLFYEDQLRFRNVFCIVPLRPGELSFIPSAFL